MSRDIREVAQACLPWVVGKGGDVSTGWGGGWGSITHGTAGLRLLPGHSPGGSHRPAQAEGLSRSQQVKELCKAILEPGDDPGAHTETQPWSAQQSHRAGCRRQPLHTVRISRPETTPASVWPKPGLTPGGREEVRALTPQTPGCDVSGRVALSFEPCAPNTVGSSNLWL